MIFETDNIIKIQVHKKSNLLRVELSDIKVGNLTFPIRFIHFHSIHSLYSGKQVHQGR